MRECLNNQVKDNIEATIRHIGSRIQKAESRLQILGISACTSPEYMLEENVKILLHECLAVLQKLVKTPLHIDQTDRIQLGKVILEHMEKSHHAGGVFQFERLSLTKPSRQMLVFNTLQWIGINTETKEELQRWMMKNCLSITPGAHTKAQKFNQASPSYSDDGFKIKPRVSFLIPAQLSQPDLQNTAQHNPFSPKL